MPELITINKGNWSGEDTTLTYDEVTGIFTIGSYVDDFELWFNREQSGDGFTCYDIVSEEYTVIGTVSRFDTEDVWFAMVDNGEIDREHENRFVAAAQLICNLI